MRNVNRRDRGWVKVESKDKVLFAEKINERFRRMTGVKQNCGLSVCNGMIKESVEGINIIGCNGLPDLHNAISKLNPKVVVIEALWLRAENLVNISRQYPKIKFYVHIHSNINFLVVESHAIKYIDSYLRLGHGVIFNCIHAYNAFKQFTNTHYLPNIYSKEFMDLRIKNNEELHIGCFGSLRPMKNHLMQAIGAIKYADSVGKKLKFHVNSTRMETGGEAIKMCLASLFQMHPKHEIVNDPWSTHGDFIKKLSLMDVSLQVSMSESFNIVAADSVAAGVPLVTSKEIEWVSDLCYANVSDPESIAEKIGFAINSPLLVNINRGNLTKFNEFATSKWKHFVSSHE